MPDITVATFNTHTGMDGWGRPFDLVEACRELDADVLALQEVYAPRDGVSHAQDVAAELGYTATELPLARCWRLEEPVWDGKGWEPRKHGPGVRRALYVGGRLCEPRRRLGGYEEGTWGLAILSRLEVAGFEAIDVGSASRDPNRRAAIAVDLLAQGGASSDPAPAFPPVRLIHRLRVICTHAPHLAAGSPLFFRRLGHAARGHGPAVLAGDMNLWGPPLVVFLHGWRRAAKGQTWPARSPHSQADHILVSGPVSPVSGGAVRVGNSDHLALRATIALE